MRGGREDLEEGLDGANLHGELALHHAGGLGASEVDPAELDGDRHVDFVADTDEGEGDVVLSKVLGQVVDAAGTRATELELAGGGSRSTSIGDKAPKRE